MDLYNYIAQNNPDGALFVCRKYGYAGNISSVEELAFTCKNMVASEGESAFVDLLKCHPDKEVIVEVFSEKKNELADVATKVESPKANATGDTNSGNLVNMTNTYILASAIIIAFAIFSIKK